MPYVQADNRNSRLKEYCLKTVWHKILCNLFQCLNAKLCGREHWRRRRRKRKWRKRGMRKKQMEEQKQMKNKGTKKRRIWIRLKKYILYEIWGSHGGESSDYGPIDWHHVVCMWLQTFWWKIHLKGKRMWSWRQNVPPNSCNHL